MEMTAEWEFDFFALTDQLERTYSRRIALRRVALADAWPLYRATRNPLFNKHLLWPQPSCEGDVLKRIDLIIDRARSGANAAITATVKDTGEFISLFRFLKRSEPGVLEMGIWTHDKFWHGRYSLEVGRLCVSAAFQLSHQVRQLVGASFLDNRGSWALMEAVGMKATQVAPRPTEKGFVAVLQEFAITRADWQANHATPFGYVEQATNLIPQADVTDIPPVDAPKADEEQLRAA